MKFIFFILIVFHLQTAQAEFFQKKDFAVSLAAQYNSLLQKRGIITYEGYQVFPSVAVQFFNPRLFSAGKALYYVHPLGESSLKQIRLRLNFDSTLDRPLYYTTEEKTERVRRDSTSEFDFFYEYNFEQGSQLRWNYSQDLIAHKGFYTEFFARYALGNYLIHKNGKAFLQPNFFASLGSGNRTHNEYLYGEGASGWRASNYEYGVYIASPAAIDTFWPVLQISRFELLGEENRKAPFVQETSGWRAQILVGYKIY